MQEAWKQLVRLGVPDGIHWHQAPLRMSDQELGQLVREVAYSHKLRLRERELLAAWVGAFRRHWPSRFEAVFGKSGNQLHADLRCVNIDPNRYLKQRRIALSHLAQLL